jgi:hypothetical protein
VTTHTTDVVKQALAAITKDMDPSTGMYPDGWRCTGCGAELNADGGHPAELYAGTYTGLCCGCERKPYFVVAGSELPDGGRQVSHPPHCPSWRRSREEYWSYENCAECGGAGMRMIHRHDACGGPYPMYCRTCMDRVMAPRKANELQLLTDVAAALEMLELVELPADEERSAAWRTLVGHLATLVPNVLKVWADVPTVWRPTVYVLQTAEARLKPAQRRAKRPDTLRRHLVAALRAEAEERTA